MDESFLPYAMLAAAIVRAAVESHDDHDPSRCDMCGRRRPTVVRRYEGCYWLYVCLDCRLAIRRVGIVRD